MDFDEAARLLRMGLCPDTRRHLTVYELVMHDLVPRLDGAGNIVIEQRSRAR